MNVFTLTLALLFNSIVSSKATLSTIEKELDLIEYFVFWQSENTHTHKTSYSKVKKNHPYLSDFEIKYAFYYSNNGHLMKMLFLSGIQTIPGVLIVPRLHPQHVNHKEISGWLENFHKNPLSLQSLCRIRVRRCLGNTLLLKVQSLPIPPYLKDFVALKNL